MPNLFTTGMGMKAVLRSKPQETGRSSAWQPQERDDAAFQKMLAAVQKERPTPKNRVANQKAAPLNPGNRLGQPLNSKVANRAPAVNAKKAMRPDKAEKERSDAAARESAVPAEEDLSLVAAQEATDCNVFHESQNGVEWALTEAQALIGPAGQTAAPELTPESTPTATPRTIKSSVIALAAQSEGVAPVTVRTEDSLWQGLNPELQVANQADAASANGTPALTKTMVSTVVVPSTGLATDPVTIAVNAPNPELNPVKAEALPQMASSTDFRDLLAATQAVTGEGHADVAASNLASSNTVAPIVAPTVLPTDTSAPDGLHSDFTYNMVMAGMSLPANKGMTPGNTPASPTLSRLSIPAGALVKTARQGQNGSSGPANDPPSAPQAQVELFASSPGQVLNGRTENAVRENWGPSFSAVGESADLPLQIVAVSGGVTEEATVAGDKTKSTSIAKTSTKRPAVAQTGVELLGVGGANATATVVHTRQSDGRQEAAPVNKDELFTQIVAQAKVMAHEGQSAMELSLKPEHLGKLKMKITVEHQVVTAQFTVESEQVKQIIETNLVQLRKMLQDAGAQVQNLNVTIGQPNDGNANYAQQHPSGDPGSQAPRRNTSGGKAPEAADHPEVNRVPAKSQAIVDLIA
jgi:hypothetical protein